MRPVAFGWGIAKTWIMPAVVVPAAVAPSKPKKLLEQTRDRVLRARLLAKLSGKRFVWDETRRKFCFEESTRSAKRCHRFRNDQMIRSVLGFPENASLFRPNHLLH
jgi:hypothetical protein